MSQNARSDAVVFFGATGDLAYKKIGELTELSLLDRPHGEEMSAYQRLLGDAMAGDATLFARQDAVEAAWAVVDPVLGNATPVHDYAPGSWGPVEAERLTADVGGWAQPKASK